MNVYSNNGNESNNTPDQPHVLKRMHLYSLDFMSSYSNDKDINLSFMIPVNKPK